MDLGQITPGCYYHTASEYEHNLISAQEFFSKCLSHLGPTSVRGRHPEDADAVEKQVNPLFWRGTFGPVAAAIKLCESDPLAGSVDANGLVPLFLACTVSSQTLESVQALDSQKVLASPLFHQALIVTALQSGHELLVQDLVRHTPTTSPPPPPDTCVFKMRLSSLVDKQGISAGVWAALVAMGWALPSRKLVLYAAPATNGTDGVALLNAIVAAGFDLHANPLFKQILPVLALTTGEPEVLEYLFDIYSITPTDDMLLQTLEHRQKGGVEVLRWLLDTYQLDVNHVRQGSGPLYTSPQAGDPRDRAEREYAMRQAGTPQAPRTALQAAALRHNNEAYEFLLERGAADTAGGGQQ